MQKFVLVPVEPTVEMIQAGDASFAFNVSKIYGAMLASAPQPPALGGEPEVYKHRLLIPAHAHSPNSPTTYRSEWVYAVLLDDHRAHVAQLQAEVERLRGIERSYELREALLEQIKGERDRMIERTLELSPEVERLTARTAELEGLLREALELARRNTRSQWSKDIIDRIDAALAEGKEHE